MISISDELREGAQDIARLGVVDIASHASWLCRMADRIDNETVELPMDKNGKPIKLGETVYDALGTAWHVEGVLIGTLKGIEAGDAVCAKNDKGKWRSFRSEWLTHERPDSLERIAEEMFDASNDTPSHMLSVEMVTDWAERIMNLAGVHK